MPETLENPVIPADMDGIKAMAQKYIEQMKGSEPLAPAPAPANPAPQPAAPVAAPTPKPDAPLIDPDLDKADAPDEVRSNAGREQWKRLSQSAKSFRDQAAAHATSLEEAKKKMGELEESLKRYSTLPVAPDQIEKIISERDRLTKEHGEIVSQLETVALERSPNFQNWWSSETKKHIDVATRMAPPEKREELAKLLLQPTSVATNAQIDAIIGELPDSSKRMIERAWENLEVVKQQREDALQKGSQRYKELMEHQALERDKESKAQTLRREQLVSAAISSARQYDSFKTTPTDTAKTLEVQQREAFVQAAVRGQLKEDLIVAIPGLAAHALYLEQSLVPQLRSDLAKANDLIKQLQGAGPRPSEGGKPASQPLAKSDGNEFSSKIRELMGNSRTGV